MTQFPPGMARARYTNPLQPARYPDPRTTRHQHIATPAFAAQHLVQSQSLGSVSNQPQSQTLFLFHQRCQSARDELDARRLVEVGQAHAQAIIPSQEQLVVDIGQSAAARGGYRTRIARYLLQGCNVDQVNIARWNIAGDQFAPSMFTGRHDAMRPLTVNQAALMRSLAERAKRFDRFVTHHDRRQFASPV